MKRVAMILAVVLTIWVGLVLGAEKLFLWPTTDPIDTDAERAVHEGIEVWIKKAATEPRAFVLRFYGNADRAERWIASEALEGVEVWAVNYPGFGGSTGRATLAGVAKAADVAAAKILERANGRPVIVFGTSMGTVAALRVAATREVRGVFLHNPPALKQMVLGQFGWWNLWLLAAPIAWRLPDACDSVQNAKMAKAPAVFALSERDEVVPPRFQALVEEAYAAEKHVVRMKGLGHNDPLTNEAQAALRAAVAKWVE